MGKVLDFTSRLRTKTPIKEQGGGPRWSPQESILDISEIRQEMINRDRREVKRTILTEFVGAFIVLPEEGLSKVSLYDISENGIAFDMDQEMGRFRENDEVAMRVYLNHSTYFPFTIRINNSRVLEEEGLVRHGAHFVKGSINDVALHHFVKFIENVSASLEKDGGDILVSNIT